MKTPKTRIPSYLRRRGKSQVFYVRRRIPLALRAAYPRGTREVTRSLGTSNLKEAMARVSPALASIQRDFDESHAAIDLRKASLSPHTRRSLTDEQLAATARYYRQCALQGDEQRRQDGMDDEEFDELSATLTTQRAELGRLLARGRPEGIWPALQTFLHLCGLTYEPNDPDQARRACGMFLRAVVDTLDAQLARQAGARDPDAEPDPIVHPLRSVVPGPKPADGKRRDWEGIFHEWNANAESRPKSTTIAYRTPWEDLRRFATQRGVSAPAQLTPQLMSDFVRAMRDRGLAVDTVNERLTKLRSIFKVGVGRFLMPANPAAETLGVTENRVKRNRKRRLPFDDSDLARIFGSGVFTQHLRSMGQAGEATYWLPMLLLYTGARPEEIAGLALQDLCEHETLGWYLNIVDRPSSEDEDLYEDLREFEESLPFTDVVPDSHSRLLKNDASVRRVPVAQQLLDAGLLRYVEWLRARNESVLFPDLRKDCHGKLSGSFSKFFGRYKRAVGIRDPRKVMYSFRHSMKDFMERAAVPSKYLQRILGHTSGDGKTTDTYGSDVPFPRVVRYFRQVQFPIIPALPWQPKQGVWRTLSGGGRSSCGSGLDPSVISHLASAEGTRAESLEVAEKSTRGWTHV